MTISKAKHHTEEVINTNLIVDLKILILDEDRGHHSVQKLSLDCSTISFQIVTQ